MIVSEMNWAAGMLLRGKNPHVPANPPMDPFAQETHPFAPTQLSQATYCLGMRVAAKDRLRLEKRQGWTKKVKVFAAGCASRHGQQEVGQHHNQRLTVPLIAPAHDVLCCA